MKTNCLPDWILTSKEEAALSMSDRLGYYEHLREVCKKENWSIQQLEQQRLLLD